MLNSSSSVKKVCPCFFWQSIGVMNCYGSTKLLGEYLVRESNELYNDNSYLVIRFQTFGLTWVCCWYLEKNSWKKITKIRLRIQTDPIFSYSSKRSRIHSRHGLNRQADAKKKYKPIRIYKKFRLGDLAKAFLNVTWNKNSKIEVTGATPGKTHEDYISDVTINSRKWLIPIIKQLQNKNADNIILFQKSLLIVATQTTLWQSTTIFKPCQSSVI